MARDLLVPEPIDREMGFLPARSNQHHHHHTAPANGQAVLVGRSAAMREVFKAIGRVAPTRVTVLVTGESGTGKELVARAIHEAGPFAGDPFVAVNCAALTPSLLESELFGHARGAFTDAVVDRVGRFEAAGEGTILLDDVGELDLALQGKLLRVLEERSFERIGETSSRTMHARIVATTNRELTRAVAEGRFREDLLHRLQVVAIHLPPLRDRIDDIPLLVEHLLARIALQLGTRTSITEDALATLERQPWPGNVRQLYNTLQRAALRSPGSITAHTLAEDAAPPACDRSEDEQAIRSLADVEREHIVAVLRQLGWHKRRTAEALGISRVTLDRKIQRYALKPDS